MQFEFALPHLEEAYDSNISIELFTYYDQDESGILEEDEFAHFSEHLQAAS